MQSFFRGIFSMTIVSKKAYSNSINIGVISLDKADTFKEAVLFEIPKEAQPPTFLIQESRLLTAWLSL